MSGRADWTCGKKCNTVMNGYEIMTAIGTTITAVTAVTCMFVLRGAVARIHPGIDNTAADPQHAVQRSVDDNLRYGRFAMECLVTLSVLMVGLYDVTASSASADSQKWASAIIGAVIGYWLKGSQTPARANGNGNANGGGGYREAGR